MLRTCIFVYFLISLYPEEVEPDCSNVAVATFNIEWTMENVQHCFFELPPSEWKGTAVRDMIFNFEFLLDTKQLNEATCQKHNSFLPQLADQNLRVFFGKNISAWDNFFRKIIPVGFFYEGLTGNSIEGYWLADPTQKATIEFTTAPTTQDTSAGTPFVRTKGGWAIGKKFSRDNKGAEPAVICHRQTPVQTMAPAPTTMIQTTTTPVPVEPGTSPAPSVETQSSSPTVSSNPDTVSIPNTPSDNLKDPTSTGTKTRRGKVLILSLVMALLITVINN